jgi:hypothetical protein
VLLHDSDPWGELQAWCGDHRYPSYPMFFQMREHTLARMRAGYFLHAPPPPGYLEFGSPLYWLYHVQAP